MTRLAVRTILPTSVVEGAVRRARRHPDLVRRLLPVGSRRRSLARTLAGVEGARAPEPDVLRSAEPVEPDVSIVVTARDHPDATVACLASIQVAGAGLTHGPDAESGVKRQGSRARVLVVDYQVPRPDRDAGSVRMLALVRSLVDVGCSVSFVPDDGVWEPPYVGDLQRLGVEVLEGGRDQALLIRDREPELYVLSRPEVAIRWMRAARALTPEAVVLYDTVDLHALRYRRMAEVEGTAGAAGEATFFAELERALVNMADATAVVSDVEAEAVEALSPGARVVVLPTAHAAVDPIAGFDERSTVLFVGSWRHEPNLDAARILATEIAPRLAERVPGVVIELVGSHPPPELACLASDVVQVHGWEPDLTPVYRRARVAAIPLRYGAGVKGKVGEALAHGVPVVTTPIGAEGIGLVDGEHARITESVDDFLDAIVELYTDPASWWHLATGGRALVARELSEERLRARVDAVVRELVGR